MSQADYQSLRLTRIRLSKIDPNTGAPVIGATNGYVSNSQIQAQIGVTTIAGASGDQANGDGTVCATFQDPDRLKNVTITLDLCSADPITRSFLTGGQLLTDPSHTNTAVGYQAPSTASTLNTPICFEAWTRAWDGNAQAIGPSTTPNVAYWHWVFPWATFVEDTTTLANAIGTFPCKGISVPNPSITANGPFNDWPIWVADAGGITQCYGYFLDGTAPPAATDARIPVPSGS